MSAERESRDAGRRRRLRPDSAAACPPPPGQPISPFAPLDLVSADELEWIHRTALTVLKEIGIDFLHDGARTLLREASADVDHASKRVRLDPALVEAQIGRAPKSRATD